MTEGRGISTFGEELPIDAARKRAILECTPICSDLCRIVAEYAQLTLRERLISYAEESVAIWIRASYAVGGTAGLKYAD